VIISPRQKRGRPAKRVIHNGLTRRQKQVLELASNGYSNAQIASLIGISRRTVSHHLQGIKTQIAVSPQTLIAEDARILSLNRTEE